MLEKIKTICGNIKAYFGMNVSIPMWFLLTISFFAGGGISAWGRLCTDIISGYYKE